MALKVGELFATLNLATGDFDKGLSKAQSSFSKAALLITDAGIGAAKSVINIGMSFESAMSEVQAISGASTDELKRLTDTAKEYGATTSFTATDSANALKYMALAGWDANQSIDALPGVLNMAAASGMDLAQASDAVTDYLSAFGMEAQQATYMADAMAKAQATSNTSARQLADAWGNSAAAMHSAGQDMETTTAALMVLANQGLKGSEAGTAMTAVMRDLTQKMEDGAIAIGHVSVPVQDAQGNFRDLNDIMRDVAAATEGMGSAEKSAALMTTFTARSIKAVNMLLNDGVDSLDAYEKSIRKSTGTASEQAEIMLNNLAGSKKIFESALEGLQLELYESSKNMLTEAVRGATGVITAFTNAAKDGFSAESLSTALEATFDYINQMADTIADGAVNLLDGFTRALPTISEGLTEGLRSIIANLRENLPGILDSLAHALPGIIDGLFNGVLPELLQGAVELLGSLVAGIISNLPEIVPALVKGFGNIVPAILHGIENAIIDIGDSLIGLFVEHVDLQDAWDAFLAQADTEMVATISAEIDGELTYSDVLTDIDTAITDIQNALKGITIDEGVATAIETAVKRGSGVPVFNATLEALGVDPGISEKVAEDIGDAMDTINAAYEGLGLSDEARTAIDNLLKDGATKDQIQTALEGYGVDTTTAATAAEKLTAANDTINGALGKLGIDEDTKATLRDGISTNSKLISTSLKALGVPQDVIDSVVASYESATSSIGEKLDNVYGEILGSLTDGKKDSDAEMALLENEVRAVYAGVVKDIEKWRDEEMAKLDPASATYKTDVDEIQSKADEMVTTLGEQEQAALSFISTMAGQSTELVLQHTGEMYTLLEETKATVREYENFIAGAGTSLEEKAFNIVAAGLSATPQQFGQAFDFAKAEFERQYTAEMAEFAAEINRLTEQGLSGDKVQAEADAAAERIRAQYESRIAAIFRGIAKDTIDPSMLSEMEATIKQLNVFEKVGEWITAGYDTANIPPELETALRDYMGDVEGMTEEIFQEKLRDIAENGEYAQSFDWEPFKKFVGEGKEALEKALKDGFATGNFDTPEIASAIKAAIEAGIFEGTRFENFDASQIQELFQLIFAGPFEVETPELTYDESGLTEQAQEMADAANETIDAAFEESDPVTIQKQIDAETTVGEVDTTVVNEEIDQQIQDGTTDTVETPVNVQANVSNVDVAQGESGGSLLDRLKSKVSSLFGLGGGTSTAVAVDTDVAVNVSLSKSNAEDIGKAEGDKLVKAMADAIKNNTKDVASAAEALASSAKDAIKDLPKNGEDTGSGFVKNMTSGITSNTGANTSAVEALVTAINTAISGLPDDGSNTGNSFVTSMTSSIQGATGANTAAVETLVSAIIDAISGLPDDGSTTGTAFVSAMTSAIQAATGANTDAAAAVATGIVTAISDLPTQGGDTGTAFITNLTQGIINGTAANTQAAATVASGIATAVSGLPKIGTDTGSGFSTNLAAGIWSGKDSVSSASGSLASAAKDAISGLSKDASNSGYSFASGFANGIRNNTYLATNAAREMARKALNTLKDTIRQGSPSKETMESGEYFSEGFGLGMLNELLYIKRSAGEVASTAVDMLRKEIKAGTARLEQGMVESGEMFSEGFGLGLLNELLNIKRSVGDVAYTAIDMLRDEIKKGMARAEMAEEGADSLADALAESFKKSISGVSGTVEKSANILADTIAESFKKSISGVSDTVEHNATSVAKSAITSLKNAIVAGVSDERIANQTLSGLSDTFVRAAKSALGNANSGAQSEAATNAAIASLSGATKALDAFKERLILLGETLARLATIESNRISEAYRAGSAQQSVSEAIDYDKLANAMNQRGVALVQNGRVTAQVQAEDNFREFNNTLKRISLGTGEA